MSFFSFFFLFSLTSLCAYFNLHFFLRGGDLNLGLNVNNLLQLSGILRGGLKWHIGANVKVSLP